MSELNKEEIIEYLQNSLNDEFNFKNCTRVQDKMAIKGILDLYQKEKEKNKELEKQYKILEVEKVRYHIQYLESDISQTPDTAMVYHSMKKHLETLKEEKIKLEAELQELLEERNK